MFNLKTPKISTASAVVNRALFALIFGLLLIPSTCPMAQTAVPNAVASSSLSSPLSSPRRLGFGAVSAVAWSPDGGTLGLAADGGVYLLPYKEGSHTLDRLHARLIPTDQIAANGIAFDPNGQELAVALANGTVRIIDLKTGQTTATLNGPEPVINKVTYSPDGHWLAFVDADAVRVFDPSTYALKFTLPGHSGVAFSPDSAWIASPTEGDAQGDYVQTISVWSVQSTGAPVFKLQTGFTTVMRTVAFSPDGTQLLAGGDSGPILRWFIRDGQVQTGTVTQFQPAFSADQAGEFYNGVVEDISFSPAHPAIAAALISRDYFYPGDVGVTVWNTLSGETMMSQSLTAQPIQTIALHPHEDILALGGDLNFELWQVAGKQALLNIVDVGPINTSGYGVDPDRAVYMGAEPRFVLWENSVFDSQTGVNLAALPTASYKIDRKAINQQGTLMAVQEDNDGATLTLYQIQPTPNDVTLTTIGSVTSDSIFSVTMASNDALVYYRGDSTIVTLKPGTATLDQTYSLPDDIASYQNGADPYVIYPAKDGMLALKRLIKAVDYTLTSDGTITVNNAVIPADVSWYGFGYHDLPTLYAAGGNTSMLSLNRDASSSGWSGTVFDRDGHLRLQGTYGPGELLRSLDPSVVKLTSTVTPIDKIFLQSRGLIAVTEDVAGDWVWDWR